MSLPKSPFFHTARLYVQPFPGTSAGHLAILKHLKTYGQVAVFRPKVQANPKPAPATATTTTTTPHHVVNKPKPDQQEQQQQHSPPPQNYNVRGSYYTVAFTGIMPLWQTIPDTKIINFTVTSNANTPNPRDEDPYNIRGLLDRKPVPEPETFACTLRRHREELIEPRVRRVYDDAAHNDGDVNDNPRPLKPISSLSRTLQSSTYSRGFRVKVNDPFKDVLEKSGTPPALVKGLLEVREDVKTDGNYRRRNAKGVTIKDLARYRLADMYREAIREEKDRDEKQQQQ